MRWRACNGNVKKSSVNGGQLPTCSLIPPRLVGKKKFCTFADVEEYHYSRPQRPRGAGKSQTYTYIYTMAKSKSGGTRSFIRGKIGADVYSIGKNGKGAKQQVVRSLAEVVSNPQTEAQMKGRMIMSTVMQAVSALSQFIDHSFDGRPSGQPSLSEFISRNYQLVKADVAAHPSSGIKFELNKYQEKGARNGEYLISYGKVIIPAQVTTTVGGNLLEVKFDVTYNVSTIGKVLEDLELNQGDMVTMLGFSSDGAPVFFRLKVKEDIVLTTVVTSSNIASFFDIEATGTVTFVNADGRIEASMDCDCWCAGLIYSKKVGSAWEHSTSYMSTSCSDTHSAAQVLPTYPTGQERFLNGGDI